MKLNCPLQTVVLICYSVILSYSVAFCQSHNKNLTFTNPYQPVIGKYIDIIIDPGHGGNDKGCQGHHLHEKNEVLDIALDLGQILQSHSDLIRVHYTRTSDRYVSLPERIKIANEQNGDLFVSIHCNSNEYKSTSGSEIFVGGLEFVNAFEHGGHQNKSVINSKTKSELQKYELPLNDKMIMLKNSLDLAFMVEAGMKENLPYKSRGVKEEGFAVLKYVTMPGILIEAGFLTNNKEANYIKSQSGKLKIANSIAQGIKKYIDFHQLEKSKQSQITQSNISHTYFNKQIEETALINSYTIQIASSFERPIIQFDDKWDGVDSLMIIKKDQHYHYRVGKFKNIMQAKEVLDNLQNDGFEDAFIINESYIVEAKMVSP